MPRALDVPVVITPPAALPVTLAAVKNFARIDTSADDDLINGFIAAATEMAENYTGRAFISRTLQLSLDRFPCNMAATPWWDGVVQGPVSMLRGYPDPILLPSAPIQSVTGIITYDQTDTGTPVDASTFSVDTVGGRITLKSGQYWPTSLRDTDAVAITYVAGYGDTAASVPQSICTAILMQAQMMYDSRTACQMCDGPRALLDPFRLLRL